MSLRKKYWDPLYVFCTSYVLYFIILFAVIFLTVAFAIFETDEIWRDLFKGLGFTMVSSGVFAVILKSEQFSNIFHKELRNIIYSEEQLEKRTDLDKIWEKVTLALCRQKFKNISSKLHQKIKGFYLPVTQEYYYKNYNLDLTIELDPINPDFVRITEINKTQIISHDIQCIKYDFQSKIPVPDGDTITSYELQEFSVNNEKIDIDKHLSIKNENGILDIQFNYDCTGKTVYNIVRKEKKSYNLKSNPYRIHLAAWLIENFYLDLHYNKNMKIDFIEMGLLDKFTIEHMDNLPAYKRFKATLTGLIFKKQGFMLFFKEF
ncbi:hypothetical protein NU08_2562 [Flavobacterium anhuiense]|uniref:Uncharacterized protein n=1 Tax=Flavobacterium anhuiense TaxID=459526 RepID=A0A444VY93_9FLAO|nr:hypothetical protein [Flavobacterium anhuiense]RYJ38585.1 hypothetical protein NU08_2562 [Flavobacterium anhuiense]